MRTDVSHDLPRDVNCFFRGRTYKYTMLCGVYNLEEHKVNKVNIYGQSLFCHIQTVVEVYIYLSHLFSGVVFLLIYI